MKSFTIKGKHYLCRCLCELISENWANPVLLPQHCVSCPRSQPAAIWAWRPARFCGIWVLRGAGSNAAVFSPCEFCRWRLLLFGFLNRITRNRFYNTKCSTLKGCGFLLLFWFVFGKSIFHFSQFRRPGCEFSRLNALAGFSLRVTQDDCTRWVTSENSLQNR